MNTSATEYAARAYGVKFRIRVSERALLPAFVGRLPPGARPSPPSPTESFCCHVESTDPGSLDSTFRIRLGEDDLVVYGMRAALDAAESLIRFEVARRSPRWIFVHAGAVGWKDRAILVPGRSFSGKSTLVRALVEAGATYYSDEYAVLDRRGVVYPFPQPLMQRTAAGGRERVPIEELGGVRGGRALPVGLVVVTQFESGAVWAPEVKSAGEGLLELMANSVRAQAVPSRVMRTLAGSVRLATVIKSVRGEAAATADLLLNRHTDWDALRRSIA